MKDILKCLWGMCTDLGRPTRIYIFACGRPSNLVIIISIHYDFLAFRVNSSDHPLAGWIISDWSDYNAPK